MKKTKLHLASVAAASILVSTQAQADLWGDIVDWFEDEIIEPIETFTGDVIEWTEDAAYTVGDFIIDSASDLEDYYKLLEDAVADNGYSSSGGLDFSAPTSPAAESGELVVATYNVKGFPDALSGLSNSEMKQVSTKVENWAWDIAVFQEDWVKNDKLMQNLTTLTYPSRSRHYAGTASTFGDGLLTIAGHDSFDEAIYREEFNDCDGTFWEYITGETSSPDCESNKGFTMAKVQLASDFTVHVYNTHLNTGKIEWLNQSQLAQISDYIAKNSEGYPVLVMGDFNMRFNKSHQKDSLNDFLDTTGLTITCDKSCDGDRIDHIMFRGNDDFKFTLVKDETLSDGGLSDHAPRQATLAWERIYPALSVTLQSDVDENPHATGEPHNCGDNSAGNVVLSNVMSVNGTDPSVLRMYQENGECYVLLQEDESKDSETAHNGEYVNIFSFSKDFPHGETGVVSVDERTVTVQLSQSFNNPVVLASIATMNGNDPAVVTIENITASSFDVTLNEFEWDDGSRNLEDVHYLVIEEGVYEINGKTAIAGVADVTTTFNGSNLNQTAVDVSSELGNTWTRTLHTIQQHDSNYILGVEMNRVKGELSFGFMPEEAKDNNGDVVTGKIGYFSIQK